MENKLLLYSRCTVCNACCHVTHSLCAVSRSLCTNYNFRHWHTYWVFKKLLCSANCKHAQGKTIWIADRFHLVSISLKHCTLTMLGCTWLEKEPDITLNKWNVWESQLRAPCCGIQWRKCRGFCYYHLKKQPKTESMWGLAAVLYKKRAVDKILKSPENNDKEFWRKVIVHQLHVSLFTFL